MAVVGFWKGVGAERRARRGSEQSVDGESSGRLTSCLDRGVFITLP